MDMDRPSHRNYFLASWNNDEIRARLRIRTTASDKA
jgi:hypothetical protein